MNNEKINISNLKTTANAIEVATQVIRGVAGNEVSDTISGVPLRDVLADTVAAKIKSKLSHFVGDK